MNHHIQSIKSLAYNTRDNMTTLGQEAKDRIVELESIQTDAEEVGAELDEYISNLDGLEANIEKASSVIDDGEMQNIHI